MNIYVYWGKKKLGDIPQTSNCPVLVSLFQLQPHIPDPGLLPTVHTVPSEMLFCSFGLQRVVTSGYLSHHGLPVSLNPSVEFFLAPLHLEDGSVLHDFVMYLHWVTEWGHRGAVVPVTVTPPSGKPYALGEIFYSSVNYTSCQNSISKSLEREKGEDRIPPAAQTHHRHLGCLPVAFSEGTTAEAVIRLHHRLQGHLLCKRMRRNLGWSPLLPFALMICGFRRLR